MVIIIDIVSNFTSLADFDIYQKGILKNITMIVHLVCDCTILLEFSCTLPTTFLVLVLCSAFVFYVYL